MPRSSLHLALPFVVSLGASLAAAPLLVAHASPPAASAKAAQTYGAPLSKAAPTDVNKVVADPDAFAGKTVVASGKVRAACTRRGCWMELAPSVAKGPQGCRVTFKDYGFFVPTDSAGADAVVEGTVVVRTVPPAEVKHYESEGATFAKKAPDGSAREVRIVATGVELRK